MFRRRPKTQTPLETTMKRGGLRIYHPTLRNAVVMVPKPPRAEGGVWVDRPYVVDGDGYCLVSEGRWDTLERAKAHGYEHGFVVVNVVNNPPAQGLSFAQPIKLETHRRTYRVEQEALRELTPAGIVPTVVESKIPSLRSS